MSSTEASEEIICLLYMSLFKADLDPSLNSILLIATVDKICMQLIEMCPYWRPIFFTDHGRFSKVGKGCSYDTFDLVKRKWTIH